jgi:prolyl oligopeptidase
MDEVRLYAPAADGTRIPVTLVYRKSTQLTGENAVLLEAYGAYGRTLSPVHDPARLAWLERGGVLAFAHVRGGGEYGAAWHEAARNATRAVGVADFVASAEFLVAYGFTNARRLAVSAEGAGGIVVGGAVTRRPELFAAAVFRSPLMDLVNIEHGIDGRARAVELPGSAEALAALSPYHQLREGVSYPAMLFDVSDPAGGDAWHSAKMVARLQAAGARPALLRTGPRDRAEALADHYAFAWSQLGEPGFAVRAPEPAAAAVQAAPPERGDD